MFEVNRNFINNQLTSKLYIHNKEEIVVLLFKSTMLK